MKAAGRGIEDEETRRGLRQRLSRRIGSELDRPGLHRGGRLPPERVQIGFGRVHVDAGPRRAGASSRPPASPQVGLHWGIGGVERHPGERAGEHKPARGDAGAQVERLPYELERQFGRLNQALRPEGLGEGARTFS